MGYNPQEDIDSPDKIQARKELEKDFSENIDNGLIENTDKLGDKDKENITSRLVTEYGKDKEGFNLIDSLETILLDETLSLTVGPQSPEKGESFPDFKERVIEFKYELYGDLLEEIGEVDNNGQEEKTSQIPNLSEETESKTGKVSRQVGNILDNNGKENPENKGGIESVKDNISARLNLEPKQLKERLESTSEREKNISQGKSIFFGKEQISEYTSNPKSESSNSDNLKELGNSIIEKDKITDTDLENILGNFVIDTGKENIEDYALENPEECSEALNNAFELQIEKVKDGKVNYRTETVDNLQKEILNDDLTNPLEKLEKFKKLKSEVNTDIGSKAKKREKATSGKEETEKQLQELKKQLQIEYKKLIKNPEQNKDKIKEIIEKAKKLEEQLKEKPKNNGVEKTGKDFDKKEVPDFLSENP